MLEERIIRQNQRFLRKELSGGKEGNLDGRLKIMIGSSRGHLGTRYTTQLHRFEPEYFSNFLCLWFGSVPDCNIFSFQNLNGLSQRCLGSNNLKFLDSYLDEIWFDEDEGNFIE